MSRTAQPAQGLFGYAAYGLLGLPLAMSALPVYVQIPAYYTTQLGMPLALTGWILFLARLLDVLQDPLLGYLIDRIQGRMVVWFASAGLMLALAFYGLWLPPVSATLLPLWLAAMLVLAYSAHSMLNIAYLSWGARIDQGKDTHRAMLKLAAWREGSGLAGVILASTIPGFIFLSQPARIASQLTSYCVAFGLILAAAIAALLSMAPPWQRVRSRPGGFAGPWANVFSNRAFTRLLVPYFINAISVSVPATLVIFFINDRLQASHYTPAFLSVYFIAAALGLPCWVTCARKWGVSLTWRLGMLLAVVAFASAGSLGTGQTDGFFVICFLSGLALGADLALPPVLLAQVIDINAPPAAYYSIWTLLGKLALAASGLTLPLLAWFDYHPGTPAGMELAWAYAGVPCILKLVALLLLTRLTSFEEMRPV